MTGVVRVGEWDNRSVQGGPVRAEPPEYAVFNLAPSDPSDPSAPSDPSDPSDKSDPSDPSDPSDSSDPSAPSDSSDSSDPSDPSDPSDKSEKSDPSDLSDKSDMVRKSALSHRTIGSEADFRSKILKLAATREQAEENPGGALHWMPIAVR